MTDILGFPSPDQAVPQHPRILHFLDGAIIHGSHEERDDGTFSYRAFLKADEGVWGEILDRFDGDANTRHIGQSEQGVTIDFVQPIEHDISRIEIVPES
jgi:hypothetical protein